MAPKLLTVLPVSVFFIGVYFLSWQLSLYIEANYELRTGFKRTFLGAKVKPFDLMTSKFGAQTKNHDHNFFGIFWELLDRPL